MGLNFDIIGQKTGPYKLEYNWNKIALYALSVGSNVNDELNYVYEKNLKIIPTYWASILGLKSFTDAYEYGQCISETLHYGFSIIFHKPILNTSGKLYYTIELLNIYDRGENRGSIGDIEAIAFDEDREKVFTLNTKDIDMSSGGFDGDPLPKESIDYPIRDPDFVFDDYIGPNQAALYRIDNDPNILHIDPDFARKAGFKKPIIMGMCTAGYACRALIHTICNDSPEKIEQLQIRFTSILEVDSKITTHIWRLSENEYVFKLINSDTEEIVLNFCRVKLHK